MSILRELHQKRSMSAGKRIIALSMVFCILLTLCGCKNTGEEEEAIQQKVKVETKSPEYRSISETGSFIGTVETCDNVSIYPKISAQVIEKNFEVGDHVNAGDVLFVLDDKALQIEKKNADANVESASAALDAQKVNNQALEAAVDETMATISTTEYEKAKAVNEAERELEEAKINREKNLQQSAIYDDDADSAEDRVNRAKNEQKKADDYYKHLKEMKEKYIKYEREDGEDRAKEYIETTKFRDYEELSTAVEAAKATVESMHSEKVSQEGTYSSSIVQRLEANANAAISKGSIANAEEAKALALKMLADYQQFTKNTLLAEANAKRAEGQANIAISDSQLESAKAAQESAELQLTYTTVKAPISGVIESINIAKYELASDQTPAYVITGQSNKKITFSVPENILKTIKEGQEVTIEKDNQLFKATITRINSSLKQGESLFRVEAAIEDTEATEFAIGSRLRLETSVNTIENTLCVPIEALYYDDGKPYVFVAEMEQAIRKDVVTGISDQNYIQILSGIDADSKVITSWSSSLKDKTDIEIVQNQEIDQIDIDNSKENQSSNVTKKIVVNIGKDSQKGTNENPADASWVETTDKVNIRKQPDTNGEKLTTVNVGSRFEKISELDNGWTKIRYNSEEAYIKSEYLK